MKRAADLAEALYRNTSSLPPPRSPASMAAAAMSGFNAYAASAGQHIFDPMNQIACDFTRLDYSNNNLMKENNFFSTGICIYFFFILILIVLFLF